MNIQEKDPSIDKINQTYQLQKFYIHQNTTHNNSPTPPFTNNLKTPPSQKHSKFHLSNFIDISQQNKFQHNKIFQTINLQQPWSLLPEIQNYLNNFFKKSTPTVNKGETIGNVYLENTNILIHPGTILQPNCVIKSPCIIGKNCQIRSGAYIRGNVIIGNKCIIGNSCQIKNSIIMNNCQIPHFNYIGDSILGTYVHMAAGAKVSNFRLDGGTVKVVGEQKQQQQQQIQEQNGKQHHKNNNNNNNNKKVIIDTKLTKFGAIIGDSAQIGCNVILNPGSLIGKNSWIYPNVSFRGYLQSNKILKLKQQLVKVQKIQ